MGDRDKILAILTAVAQPIGVVLAFALALYLGRETVFASASLPYVVVALIGSGVGATELMSRYRDAPFRPLLSLPGIIYVMLNGGAAILAYYLIPVLKVDLGKDPATANFYRIVLASFGAMAFFRSGLFTLRLGDSDVPVGPNLILQVLLNALDRTYDRIRAAPRSEEAAAIMAGISFDLAKEALPSFCFNLMQNVGDPEREEVGREVKLLAESQVMSNEAKALILGLALLNVVGRRTLQAAVSALGGSIRGSKELSMETLAALAKLQSNIVVLHLATVVRAMADPLSRRIEQKELDDIVALELPAENKAILITHALVRHYGEKSVTLALASLVPLTAPPPPSTT
jgi:hypothetical protein